MKYASLSLITLSVLGAFAIGCGSSRPHEVVDTGPTPTTDMGAGARDTGPTPPGNDMGMMTHDTGPVGHDTGPVAHDTGSTRMCTPSCTSDAQCQGTCPPAATGTSNCCTAGHCYVSHTMTCPAMGHDSGAGGSSGG